MESLQRFSGIVIVNESSRLEDVTVLWVSELLFTVHVTLAFSSAAFWNWAFTVTVPMFGQTVCDTVVMETEFQLLRISGQDYPTEEVRDAFDQLKKENVKSILDDFLADPQAFGSMRARLYEAGLGNGAVLDQLRIVNKKM